MKINNTKTILCPNCGQPMRVRRRSESLFQGLGPDTDFPTARDYYVYRCPSCNIKASEECCSIECADAWSIPKELLSKADATNRQLNCILNICRQLDITPVPFFLKKDIASDWIGVHMPECRRIAAEEIERKKKEDICREAGYSRVKAFGSSATQEIWVNDNDNRIHRSILICGDQSDTVDIVAKMDQDFRNIANTVDTLPEVTDEEIDKFLHIGRKCNEKFY